MLLLFAGLQRGTAVSSPSSAAPTHSCDGLWRSFDASLDLVALHYDCAADPDDFVSSAADRSLLEASFGTPWLADHVLPVVGAFGRNTDYQEHPCVRTAQAVWGDATGFLRANCNAGCQIAASDRALAIELAYVRWSRTIASGGHVFVKEGGQSDFTMKVVTLLEGRNDLPLNAGRCVHVVQHSVWNEDMNSAGVTTFIMRHTDYLGPKNNGRGPITDGNIPMQERRTQITGPFLEAARKSWAACAWHVALDEFSKIPSWCDWRHGAQLLSPDVCI